MSLCIAIRGGLHLGIPGLIPRAITGEICWGYSGVISLDNKNSTIVSTIAFETLSKRFRSKWGEELLSYFLDPLWNFGVFIGWIVWNPAPDMFPMTLITCQIFQAYSRATFDWNLLFCCCIATKSDSSSSGRTNINRFG